MAGKQAKILSVSDVNDLLVFAACTRHPIRNRVIVLLSAKAGLRAGEIANLTWEMVVDASGQIGSVIELRDHAAKKGSGRLIPMHPGLANALSVWRQTSTGPGHVVRSERGGPMTALSDHRWKHLQNIPAVVKFISYEPALGLLRLPKHGPFPDWLISGGESGGGARQLDPQWVRDIIADCRHKGVAPFHKQWGTYSSNPLVAEQGMSIAEAKAIDEYGKGGGLVDSVLVREFPMRP